MRKLIIAAGLLAVVVAIFAVFATNDAATVEAEGISVDANGELVLPQAGQTFLAFMNGAQEVDPVITDTTGLAVVLMNDDSSEARNSTASAISLAVPIRPSGRSEAAAA